MAGTFMIGETKVRPGGYFNIQKKGDNASAGAVNGITGILFKADWGPINEVVELSVGDGYESTFGNGGTTDAIGLAFEGGTKTAYCCRVGNGGTPGNIKLKLASEDTEAVSITAKYAGAKAFTVSIKDKLADDTQRECIIYTGTKEFEKVSFAKSDDDEVAALVSAFADSKNFSVEQLKTSDDPSVPVEGKLAAITQEAMTAGTNPTATLEDYSNGLALLEAYFVNTVCVDTEDTAVHGLLDSWLDRIFDMGQLSVGVVAESKSIDLADRQAHAAAFNTEKMVYVLNSAASSTTYGEIEGYQTAAKIAGMIAGCAANSSLTHTVLDKITALREVLTPTQMTKAEQSGCLVLSINTDKQVWIDNAINTLVTLADNQDDGWKKIRRTKTRYEMIKRMNDQADSLVGKVDNDKNGRATIISQLQGIGDSMIEEGKLVSCNVAESSTYTADGDSCWFVIDVIDKDSAEHIYLMYQFRFSTQEE